GLSAEVVEGASQSGEVLRGRLPHERDQCLLTVPAGALERLVHDLRGHRGPAEPGRVAERPTVALPHDEVLAREPVQHGHHGRVGEIAALATVEVLVHHAPADPGALGVGAVEVPQRLEHGLLELTRSGPWTHGDESRGPDRATTTP